MLDNRETLARISSARSAEPALHPVKPGKAEKPEKEAEAKPPAKEAPEEQETSTVPEPELQPPPVEKPPPPDQRAPLNRGSALTALSKAASSASSCRREGGPSGTGSASITFSPEGPVSSVSVTAPFAGTPVGTCIQTVFRSAHVPAFSGSAVTLNKSFRIPD